MKLWSIFFNLYVAAREENAVNKLDGSDSTQHILFNDSVIATSRAEGRKTVLHNHSMKMTALASVQI